MPPLAQFNEMAIVEVARPIVGGVDTHLDVHVAAAIDANGGLLGVRSFPTTPAGYHALASWLGAFGPIERVGVEGTGTYGAGVARHLAAAGITVVEVDRPNRQERRRNGKSDELDAIEAARAALSGRGRGHAKSGTGTVEAARPLLVAKRSARSIRIKTIGQLRHLVITAPDDLRVRLSGLTTKSLIAHAAAFRAGVGGGDPVRHATKTAIVTLARRVQTINREIAVLDRHLDMLVRTTAPRLLEVYGSGSTPPRSCWSPPVTTPDASATKQPGRTSVVSHPSPPAPPRPTSGDASTRAGTAKPTMRCGASCSPASAKANRAPSRTCNAVSPPGEPNPRSSVHSNATSLARSTNSSPADATNQIGSR